MRNKFEEIVSAYVRLGMSREFGVKMAREAVGQQEENA